MSDPEALTARRHKCLLLERELQDPQQVLQDQEQKLKEQQQRAPCEPHSPNDSAPAHSGSAHQSSVPAVTVNAGIVTTEAVAVTGPSLQACAVLGGLARGMVGGSRGSVLPGAHHTRPDRYEYVVTHMDARYASDAWDVLANPPKGSTFTEI